MSGPVDPGIRARAVALYDRFTHDGGDRRTFLAEMATLAGGTAAAAALIAAIAADPAAAALVAADDPRLWSRTLRWTGAGDHRMSGYLALPKGAARAPAVMVVHENRGLNEHIRDVARRLALAGFAALAPDFLSPAGGTPADEDRARSMIGGLDLAATVADAAVTIRKLGMQRFVRGRPGAIGFCWGGALVNRLAVDAGDALGAAVVYYGPAPDPALAVRVKAPMLLHYAGLDARVNAGAPAWVGALKAAGVEVSAYTYPGANHAFNNDTSAERYEPQAARLAWDRTIGFFREYLR